MKSHKSLAIERQAIIIIHGIGEQRPMDTLRSFVRSIAPAIEKSSKPAYYSKPDIARNSYELRRLTATEHKDSYKTDYFELYWADLMQNTQLADIWWWIRYLFIRPARQVPTRLQWIYYTFWSSLALFILALVSLWPLAGSLAEGWESIQSRGWLKWIVSALISFLWLGITGVLVNYLGDAVRYFNPRPRNVSQRQKIRQAGIDLLERLHSVQENGHNKYDRIIIVGHSLGSVIAYDLVNFFWYAKHQQLPTLSPEVVEEAEQSARQFKVDNDLNRYQQAQFNLWRNQYKQSGSWRISDLITLGSPLAFAELYLADNKDSWQDKQKQREYATCPPTSEMEHDGIERFSYPLVKGHPARVLHHGAAFGPTRWTNIYFTNDFVGGPVNGFGTGVKNVELTSQLHSRLPFISHVYYWRVEEAKCVESIRKALQLRIIDPVTANPN